LISLSGPVTPQERSQSRGYKASMAGAPVARKPPPTNVERRRSRGFVNDRLPLSHPACEPSAERSEEHAEDRIDHDQKRREAT
jgi:hypothetical protein